MTKDVARHSLPVHQWPEFDQKAWRQVIAHNNILDEDIGRGAYWRAPTRRRMQQSYGRWLGYLSLNEILDTRAAPASRITRANVPGYVETLLAQVAPWTVWSYTLSLYLAARAFDANADWDWLYKIVAKLKARRYATKDKHSRLRSPRDIVAWAYQELDRISANHVQDKQGALAYRNALFVAVLANCPMRLRNLVMIRNGKHLVWTGERYRLDFAPSEIKTDRYLTLYLPEVLTSRIDTWIADWRPLLTNDPSIDALWVSIRGTPMSERGVYGCVVETTEAAFGVAINPHLFRDIAATSVVDLTPENAGITASLLGHINPKTTEEHYIHANQAIAGDRYRSSVTALRNRLLEEHGNPFMPKRGR